MEIVEVREIFERFGLATDNSARIAQALSERPDAWVDFMMRFELGLEEPDPKLAVTSAVTIAGAYIPGGLSPLSPYMLEQTARAWSRDAMHAFPEAKRADAAYRATSSTQIAPHNIDQLFRGLRLF